MKTLIFVLLLLQAFLVGWLFGHISESGAYRKQYEECEPATISSSELCAYLGYKSDCKGIKPRVWYAYASHKHLSCVLNRKGQVWAN